MRTKRDMARNKWLSQTELVSLTKVTFKEEYLQRKEEVDRKDNEVRFVLRLIDSWKSYQFILSNLSSNIRAELSGQYAANKINELNDNPLR
jgi:hypothetical protein